MCMSPSQLLLATHTQLSSQLLAPINNATHVYIVGIPVFIYIYICTYSPKSAVSAHSAALSRS